MVLTSLEEEHKPMYHVPMFDLDFSLETRVEWTLDGVDAVCGTRPSSVRRRAGSPRNMLT